MTTTPITAPVRESLIRSVDFRATNDSTNGDGLTLEGYAAVFDTDTEIRSWEGNFLERIQRGAFRKTIREKTPVMQFDHGSHPMIGSIPLGVVESLSEDDQGLFVRGRLSDNWLVQPVRDAIASGAVSGMSFRFDVVRDAWADVNGKKITDVDELMRLLWEPGDRGPIQRTLIEVRAHELGPVVFPAYPTTSVGVRSREVIEILRKPDVLPDLARALFVLGEKEQPKLADGEHVLSADAVKDIGDESRESAPLDDQHPDDEDVQDDAPAPTRPPVGSFSGDTLRERIRAFKRRAAITVEYAEKGAARYERIS
jgi:HK97 family phage prohead protease